MVGREIRIRARERHGLQPACRRLTAGVVVALCTLGLPGPAVASHSPGGDRSRDFAAGSASNQFLLVLGEARLSVAAQSDPNGASPRGHVIARGDPDGAGLMEPFLVEGGVTCVDVRSAGPGTTRAAIKYRFERAEGSAEPFEGGGVQIFIEDNGEPQHGEPVDRAIFDPPETDEQFNQAGDPSRCDDPNSRAAAYDRIESGNYTVHDAPAGSGTSVPAPEGSLPSQPEAGVDVDQDDVEPSEEESTDSSGEAGDKVQEVLDGLVP